mmetsp:Transcript_6319/g.17708  ORF Transcript_6319/g.17708 Transcript_6319/m.17708 type:complete len:116 (-) Transcript_6319:5104-5451(-)
MAEGNVHHIWGASPALDLNEVLAAHASLDDEAQELHFLLVHPGDVRHVLKTLAQRGRYPNPSLDPNAITLHPYPPLPLRSPAPVSCPRPPGQHHHVLQPRALRPRRAGARRRWRA